MNPDEIVRMLREQYGINSMEELDRKIREMVIDISMFCNNPKESGQV